MKLVNGWYLFVLNAYWIGLSFMWNSLHVTILPAVLLNYVPDTQKNTWLGLLTFFGLIIAMIVQPLSGAISDRWRAKLGRRRPLMWLGTAGDLVFLTIMGFIGGLPALFIGYIGLHLWARRSAPARHEKIVHGWCCPGSADGNPSRAGMIAPPR